MRSMLPADPVPESLARSPGAGGYSSFTDSDIGKISEHYCRHLGIRPDPRASMPFFGYVDANKTVWHVLAIERQASVPSFRYP